MTKFFFKLNQKKLYFWSIAPIFGAKKVFQKLQLCHAQLQFWCVRDLQWWGSLTVVPAGKKAKPISSVKHTAKTIHYHHYQSHVKIQRNLMIQFQENAQTDGRMEGRTDPISQDPLQLLPGVWQVQLQ